MWELDYKESWASKNWCFWTVVLEKSLESPLDCKEIQPIHPKGNQSWIFIRRADAEAETPILWPPDLKSRLTGKEQIALAGNSIFTNSMDISLSKLRELVMDRKAGMLQFMGWQRVGHDSVTELTDMYLYTWYLQ